MLQQIIPRVFPVIAFAALAMRIAYQLRKDLADNKSIISKNA